MAFCNNCKRESQSGTNCPYCGASFLDGNIFTPAPQNFTLVSAYKNMFKKYADFSGRARRQEYWLATLANIIIVFAWVMLFAVFMSEDMTATEDESIMASFSEYGVMLVLLMVYGFVLLVPSYALMVRRLHDIGKSGWLAFLSFIPIGSVILFVFTCMDSQPGANMYGPNPKGFN